MVTPPALVQATAAEGKTVRRVSDECRQDQNGARETRDSLSAAEYSNRCEGARAGHRCWMPV